MESESFDTPILFLIFNRPQTTEVVFKRIREVRPKHLFISADGPRQDRPDEARLCAEARSVVSAIDWDCRVHTRFLDRNHGCRLGVSSAITWFFENINEGIVVEDDCLPDTSFFHFTRSLLEHYRDNPRIMHIGGTNFQDGRTRGSGSYYVSNLSHIWGWGTWKRAWEQFDLNLVAFPQLRKQNFFAGVFPNSQMKEFWERRFDLAFNNKIDTWDIQWQYALSVNEGLSVIPNKNLVTNIGFHEVATHTRDDFNILANIPASSIQQIHHPTSMDPDHEADYYSFRRYFSPSKPKKLYYVIRRTIKTIRKRISKN